MVLLGNISNAQVVLMSNGIAKPQILKERFVSLVCLE